MDVCIECGKPATWVRSTQFAGEHPYCEEHAKQESDFGTNDSYEYWYEVKGEIVEKLYLVETVSIFRQRYVVSAREAEHAADEVVMNVNGAYNENFEEFSQKHIDECITSVREISGDEYIRQFDEDNAYLKDWTDTQKMSMINVINYGDE